MESKTLVGDVKIPILGIGTWGMGGKYERNTTHDKEEILAIRTAVKLGMTHIDTAEVYGKGHAEELVAEAIQGFDRKKLFIVTKVSQEHLRHDDVIFAAKASLKRLKTNYIDLYLIHGPNLSIPLKETMKAMDHLVENKLVRFIGVSNFSVKEMKEAQSHSKNKIVANQIEYNLLVRNKGMWTTNMESEIIPYCQKNNIMVIAYRPIAKGELAKPGFEVLDKLSKKYKKTQAQIAINWLISKKNVITIPKSTHIEHLKENLGAIGWKMDFEDIKKLDQFKAKH